VAGGYSLDIMNAMRHAVAVSRMREGSRNMVRSGDRSSEHNETILNTSLAIDWKEALYLATQGGVEALNLPLGTGMFAVGSPFDAQQSMAEIFFF
jgi:guanine deaminase